MKNENGMNDFGEQMKIEVIEMGKFSFELEEKREQSLILQSGYMLTGFSIISVVLLAVIPILLDYTNLPKKIVFIFLGISLLFLICSLLFAIAAQWRYEYLGFKDIESIYLLMVHKSKAAANDWWLENLNDISIAKNSLNEKRARLMKISTISFAISIFTILIYLVTLLVLITFQVTF